MKRRFLTAVAVFGLLLVAGQAVALLLNFAPGQVLRAVDLNALVLALTGGDTGPIDVNCPGTPGTKLVDVLKTALPGSEIRIFGTCMEVEKMEIRTPRLTLTGQPGAIIDGGRKVGEDGITVTGVRGVLIQNLTVQNGGEAGIRSRSGAGLNLSNVIVQDNGKWGVLVENNAMAFLSDSTVRRNGQDGVAVENKSSAAIQNSTITNSIEDGIAIKNGSSARISNSIVENNGEDGISIDNGSSAEINNNTMVKGNGFAPNVKASGISVENNSSAEIRASTITINKIDGVTVEGASSAVIRESTITGNIEVGVSAENGGTVTIRGTPSQKSTITGNGVRDLEALFGALLTIDQANTIFGSLHCQPVVSFARDFATGAILTGC